MPGRSHPFDAIEAWSIDRRRPNPLKKRSRLEMPKGWDARRISESGGAESITGSAFDSTQALCSPRRRRRFPVNAFLPATEPNTADLPGHADQPGTRLTVVVSKGQSRNPEKRGLETAIATQAASLDGVDVIVIPHLYDLAKASSSLDALRDCAGDLLIVSWIFPRAARWVLDRHGVAGALSRLDADASTTIEEEESRGPIDLQSDTPRVSSLFPRPPRAIDCVDLKDVADADAVMEFIRGHLGLANPKGLPIVGGRLQEIEETTGRRWYPVIDFDRCTNCMECVDFCLFGVYGLDGSETILVEQPDNCRKGCPACSRVCPENAIIFPQHKAPAIAGAEIEGDEGFKIDLSQLFGAPAGGDDPIATAARERDEQLLLTGRDAVGIDDQLVRRQTELSQMPKDDLDQLIDQLDDFDL